MGGPRSFSYRFTFVDRLSISQRFNLILMVQVLKKLLITGQFPPFLTKIIAQGNLTSDFSPLCILNISFAASD
jgi:hypothetical protein